MSTLTDHIAQLGQQVETGELTADEAVAQLQQRCTDIPLTAIVAAALIGAWRKARARGTDRAYLDAVDTITAIYDHTGSTS